MSDINIKINLSDYKAGCLEQVVESYSFNKVQDAFLNKGLKLDRFKCIDEVEYIQREREYYLGIFKLDLSNTPLHLLLPTMDKTSSFLNSACLFFKEGILYLGSSHGQAITAILIPEDKFEVVCNPIKTILNNGGIILPGELISALSSFTTSGWELQFQLSKTESSLLIKLYNSRTRQVIFLVSVVMEGAHVRFLECIELNKKKHWNKIDIPLESLLPILGLFTNLNTKEAQSIYFDVRGEGRPLKFGIEDMSFNLMDAVNVSTSHGLAIQDTKFYLRKEDLYKVLCCYDQRDILSFVFHYRDGKTGSLIIESKQATHLFVPKNISPNLD